MVTIVSTALTIPTWVFDELAADFTTTSSTYAVVTGSTISVPDGDGVGFHAIVSNGFGSGTRGNTRLWDDTNSVFIGLICGITAATGAKFINGNAVVNETGGTITIQIFANATSDTTTVYQTDATLGDTYLVTGTGAKVGKLVTALEETNLEPYKQSIVLLEIVDCSSNISKTSYTNFINGQIFDEQVTKGGAEKQYTINAQPLLGLVCSSNIAGYFFLYGRSGITVGLTA